MPLFQFGFYQFGQFNISSPAGQSGVQLSATGNTQGVGTPGEVFSLTSGTPTITTVIVDDDDANMTDASINETGAAPLVATGSPFGPVGARVDLEYRITVQTNGVPPETQTFYVVSIGGTNVGIIGTEPLVPGVQYTILEAADQQSATMLRRYGLNGQIGSDIPGTNSIGWDALFCFTHGTLVETPDGPRLIETLEPGDLVCTLDNGSQPLRWTGSRPVTHAEMIRNADLRPVEFATGAIGNSRPLRVSPQHRILLDDWRAQVYFGEDRVLIPAKAMVNCATIRQVPPMEGLTYIHLLFDRHEVIISEGALTESFHPGEIGLGALDDGQRRELDLLFPGLMLERRRAAFPIVRMAEALALRLPG
jgi:hypothetical protein